MYNLVFVFHEGIQLYPALLIARISGNINRLSVLSACKELTRHVLLQGHNRISSSEIVEGNYF